MQDKVNPIMVEIIRNKLTAIVREASTALYRAAFSTIVREMKDYSNSLHDASGNLVAQAEGIPIFLGSMSHPLYALLDKYALAEMEEGDVYISNDPYLGGGTHKNDINVMMPYFVESNVVLFVVSKAHWMDVGGKDPGSWSPNATDSFQEGLTIPPVKLYSRGRLIREVEDLILQNTRLQEINRGDYLAQIAACFTGRKRLDALFTELTWPIVQESIKELNLQSELAIRERIRNIPDGVYHGIDYVDSDGIGETPIPVEVEVRIRGDEVEVDFSRCPSQSLGACGNSALPRTVSAVRTAMRAILAPDLPSNQGLFEPIRIVAPKGTVVNPEPPAPVTLGGLVGRAIVEAILFAFSEVAPERTMAGQFGGTFSCLFTGLNPRDNNIFVFLQVAGGGWGAKHNADGISTITSINNGFMVDCPVEVLESETPLLVEQYALREDSGGDGQFRGGLGVRQDFRVLSEGVYLSATMDRYRIPPPGVKGGLSALGNQVVIKQDGLETIHNLLNRLPVPEGAIISQQSGGGGGFGLPLNREGASVREDVLQGYISPLKARTVYGFGQG